MSQLSPDDSDFLRVVQFLRTAKRPVTLYLSAAGHPTPFGGVGGTRIGTYTKAVSIEQLEDDIREANKERRGRETG